MSMSSEYRKRFQTGKPIKSRNAECGRAVCVHSFPREGYINIGTGSAELQTLPCHSSSGCRTAGDFCQLFCTFPDIISQHKPSRDPSTDTPSLSALLPQTPLQRIFPSFPFLKEEKQRVARLKTRPAPLPTPNYFLPAPSLLQQALSY